MRMEISWTDRVKDAVSHSQGAKKHPTKQSEDLSHLECKLPSTTCCSRKDRRDGKTRNKKQAVTG